MENRRNAMAGGFAAIFGFWAIFAALCLGTSGKSEAFFYERAAAAAAALGQEDAGRGMLPDMMRAFKEPGAYDLLTGKRILAEYGYDRNLLPPSMKRQFLLMGAVCAAAVAAVGIFLNKRRENRLKERAEGLTDYLKQINSGVYPMHIRSEEDAFSKLEDELYKTVVELRESREKAEKGKENLAENLADISHQLKTPLTSMALTAELLEMHAENEEQKKGAQQILAQTDRIYELVYMLLTLSRLDAGVLPLSAKATGTQELISCAKDAVEALLANKNQQLEVRCERDSEVVCDPGWTIQALSNLIKNCSEHAPEETQIRVTVTQNPIFVQILFEDQGPGFEEEDIKRLFERFYKGKSAVGGGTGLGLAFARSILERENASVSAENGREGGAVFRVKFYVV